ATGSSIYGERTGILLVENIAEHEEWCGLDAADGERGLQSQIEARPAIALDGVCSVRVLTAAVLDFCSHARAAACPSGSCEQCVWGDAGYAIALGASRVAVIAAAQLRVCVRCGDGSAAPERSAAADLDDAVSCAARIAEGAASLDAGHLELLERVAHVLRI